MASDKGERAAASGKTSRRRSREFAVQGIYQWLLAAESPERIIAQLAEREEYARADAEHCSLLIQGVVREADSLRTHLSPHLDRPIAELSPVEHAILLLATCELTRHPDIPYRVVINEAVELAKRFGGTDGYKYINGVLDTLSATVRPSEIR